MKTVWWTLGILVSFALGWLLRPVEKPNTLAELSQMTGDRHPFATVIQSTCNRKVIPLNPQNPSHQLIRDAVLDASDQVRLAMSEPNSPAHQNRRINEASRNFEDALLTALDAHPSLSCTIPTNADGEHQRSGYPDLRIEDISSGTIAYLDPKLFEDKSIASSLRTFYYEPSDNIKVTEDALHLLIGFPHDGESGNWQFQKPHLVDLSTLSVKLKVEFSAANRDLYH
ncbi:MAG: hypothetical protein ACSHYF_12750 [Verrucomicrobiaceae bacterium]